ncbi:hypothetical protein P153DRAFT_340064 [Dothidotthia symphoricarpi CBS 119687]|uniref:Uncharacterized protein n=1 Tax=Dothidotthia symphoricarpi CBS 119687 TaxID=1392245 RepID=A0A6A6ABK2_9PLEO|nr:uncharacterized protein P153DRAFT_340064 [Dothidotthia symphoricarpi CBS 119687]KAF2129322.1 hypothetical protein P153DRAFT_340064 [Dothidotthia symphoricarpi CBS 119687]
MDPGSSISNIRDFFSRSDRQNLPPDLKRALTLLQLHTLEDLEQRFLSTDAFLKPWAVFRDSIFLLQPDAMTRTTEIFRSTEVGVRAHIGIKRLDILWFYTQFDEGTLRYDPRADKWTLEYTHDSTMYGVIDKSQWSVEEYEKHLYAWLLQEFKVGKVHNPWGFQYFELKSICAAWEDIFVPIINAVRASYSVKGRRHYGRLALFIENRSPSRLAFPEGNVGIPQAGLMSPTPFRVISVPKKRINSGGTTFFRQVAHTGVLTRKQYDDTEKELRDVYPQYGGLVERPRFKQKMGDWLAEQRARAAHRKAVEKHDEVQSFHPQVTERDDNEGPSKNATECFSQQSGRGSSRGSSRSPVKRYSDSIRRSLSLSIGQLSPSKSSKPILEPIRPTTPKESKFPRMPFGRYGSQTDPPKSPKQSPKSPLHGVTRQLYFFDADRVPEDPSLPVHCKAHQGSKSLNSIHPLLRPVQQQQNPSEQSVYTSIRNSNPFTENPPEEVKTQCSTDDSLFSPMGPLSAIPRPLYKPEPIKPKKSFHDSRIPSYEGTGYVDEISLTNLHNSRMNTAHPLSRLPAPIAPIPYAGHLRIASTDTYRDVPPKSVARPSQPPPHPVAWPGFESQDNLAPPPPPIPSKSPERWKSTGGHVAVPHSEQLLRENSHSILRIVSRENIRAALGGLSRESSEEDLAPQNSCVGPERTMSPESKKRALQTYNTHLFPRKEEQKVTPVGK